MSFCTQCGAKNPDGARFCDQCGTELVDTTLGSTNQPVVSVAPEPAVSAGPGTCPQCGAVVIPGEAFCDNCGASLLQAMSPAESTVVVPDPLGGGGVPSQPAYPPPQPVGAGAPLQPTYPPPQQVAPQQPSPVAPTPQPDPTMQPAAPATPQPTPYASARTTLSPTYLLVQSSGQSIALPDADTVLVGRSDPVSQFYPDIDLTPHGALQEGVGRRHLQVSVMSNQVYIEDLNSTNGTFLNGQKVVPETPQAVQDGDELRLGNMVLRIYL